MKHIADVGQACHALSTDSTKEISLYKFSHPGCVNKYEILKVINDVLSVELIIN